MGPRSAVLVHLCPADEWLSAQTRGELRPESLASAGFIHLSTPDQVHLPANRLYRHRADLLLLYIDLLLLYIDSARLNSPVRWELAIETDPESMRFPHLYGALPISAVINITSYVPGPDGSFPPAGDFASG